MSNDTQELIRTYEQLPQAKRVEVADFARFLLAQNQETGPQQDAAERWLASASGAAKPGTTTDQIMTLTRGEP